MIDRTIQQAATKEKKALLITSHWRYVGGQINKLELQLSIIFSPGWTLNSATNANAKTLPATLDRIDMHLVLRN